MKYLSYVAAYYSLYRAEINVLNFMHLNSIADDYLFSSLHTLVS